MPRISADWSAFRLAFYTQALLQRAFILAKAKGDGAVESMDHSASLHPTPVLSSKLDPLLRNGKTTPSHRMISMSKEQFHAQSSADEAEIRQLIETWSKAVRDQGRAGIRKDHAVDILMFDVPSPFQSQGIDAYMATWETFFSSADRPVKFDFTDVEVSAGCDVAFATAVGHCVYVDMRGRREPLDFRLTVGLRKIEGRWRITHEHHSVPAV
jgi:uncharacterized protein (TIGR02246 family)